MTVVADTADPPAIPSRRAVRAKGTSAPQVARNSRAAGPARSPSGRPSPSSSGQSILPAASSSTVRRNATSPIVVASVRVRTEWTLEPAGRDERSPRSRASRARESASAQLASAIRLAAPSSAAKPAGDEPISSVIAASRAATAPGTMLRFMCGPSSPPNPKQLEG